MKKGVWVVVLAVLLLASCRKKRETNVYVQNDEEVTYQSPAHNQGKSCISCHDWNIVQLHNSKSTQYNGDCIKCHGDKLSPVTETTLDSNVDAIHPRMCQYVYQAAGQETMNNTVCVYCHVNVDFLGQSAGNLRKQVEAESCVKCHTSAGPGKQLYED